MILRACVTGWGFFFFLGIWLDQWDFEAMGYNLTRPKDQPSKPIKKYKSA